MKDSEEVDVMLERALCDLSREFIEVLNAGVMDGGYGLGPSTNFEHVLQRFNVVAETYHAVKKAAVRFKLLDFKPLKFRIEDGVIVPRGEKPAASQK